jgi:hypothetical protein
VRLGNCQCEIEKGEHRLRSLPRRARRSSTRTALPRVEKKPALWVLTVKRGEHRVNSCTTTQLSFYGERSSNVTGNGELNNLQARPAAHPTKAPPNGMWVL